MDNKEKYKQDNTLLNMNLDHNFTLVFERIRALEVRVNLLEKRIKELEINKEQTFYRLNKLGNGK